MSQSFKNLPIYPFLEEITTTFSTKGLLLLSAAPGAGKTTLVPWNLVSQPGFKESKLLLLEPRRLAARAAANRIASLLGEKTGQTVGLRTRLETIVGPSTRLEVVTEAVLTRIIQNNKALDGYNTILFDEFHTRSLHGDLGLALAWETRKTIRPDLRIGLLSATLPAKDIEKVFPDFPLIEVPGRVFPVDLFYHPPQSSQEKPWHGATRLCQEALKNLTDQAPATVLCFLPGYYEMHQAQKCLIEKCPAMKNEIYLLHGQMPPKDQRIVLDPDNATRNRIILATNVAETSLTIPGVKAVVDIGLERRVRFLPRTGMDHWDTLPISMASAEQRKGRAGRLGPGICYRWWNEKEFREPFALPEIMEADLAPLVLETSDWGVNSPTALTWLTPPPGATLSQATGLLHDLHLLDANGQITNLGHLTNTISVHPRLARMVLTFKDSNFLDTAALIAALLESDDLLSRRDPDFRERVQLFKDWANGKEQPGNAGLLKRIWEECRRILRSAGKQVATPKDLHINVHVVGRVLLAAYPDRLAKRTRLDDPVTSRWLLASGRGGLLKGNLSQEDYLVITDLDGGLQNAKIFSAAPIIEKELLSSPVVEVKKCWSIEWKGWKPKGKLDVKIAAIVLKEQQGVAPDKKTLQQQAFIKLRNQGFSALPWNTVTENFLARCRFVEKWGDQKNWPSFSNKNLLAQAEHWLLQAGKWTGGEIWTEQSLLSGLKHYLSASQQQKLEELAPEIIRLPQGFKKKLNYRTDDIPKLSARLQEFFGCQTTPMICNQPLVLDILTPANRTMQLTRDLESFWKNTYAGVKKEFEGKYPKHQWPDNPGNKKYIKHPKGR